MMGNCAGLQDISILKNSSSKA
jgi:hypothetical protein